jgi:hypothetical protein
MAPKVPKVFSLPLQPKRSAECAGLCCQHGGPSILARLGGFGDSYCMPRGDVAQHWKSQKKQYLVRHSHVDAAPRLVMTITDLAAL